MAHGITANSKSRRHLIAEWVVEKTDSMVHENMGEYFAGFSPFIAAILMLSALSSLLTLIGLYPPTSDLNVVAGWAILVMILITHYKMKGGFPRLRKELRRADARAGAAEYHQRSGDAAFDVVPSLRKRTLGNGHFRADCCGASKPVARDPRLASRRARRSSRCFRSVCLRFCRCISTSSAAACRHSSSRC